jgi:hypothetical protein
MSVSAITMIAAKQWLLSQTKQIDWSLPPSSTNAIHRAKELPRLSMWHNDRICARLNAPTAQLWTAKHEKQQRCLTAGRSQEGETQKGSKPRGPPGTNSAPSLLCFEPPHGSGRPPSSGVKKCLLVGLQSFQRGLQAACDPPFKART